MQLAQYFTYVNAYSSISVSFIFHLIYTKAGIQFLQMR